MLRHVLFYTRFALYLLLVSVPLIHPSIVVSYDFQGIGLWFVMIPALFFIAFYFFPPRLKLYVWALVAGSVIFFGSIIIGGITLEALRIAGFSFIALFITVIIFQAQGRGRVLAGIEIVFAAILYFAYISFSRAYEDIALQSAGFAKLLMLVSLAVFVVHSIVLFLAAFPNVLKNKKRELILGIAIIVPVIITAAILLPAGFIANDIELNQRPDQLEQPLDPTNNDLDGLPGGPNLGDGSEAMGRDRDGKLEGMSPDKWQQMDLDHMGGTGTTGMGSKQYAVMIVATKAKTMYLSYKYFGLIDKYRGFIVYKNDSLNQLADMRLIETWMNPDRENLPDRSSEPAFFLSTLPKKLVAFQPVSLTPTIYDLAWRPFSYSYESVSDLTTASPEILSESPGLSADERQAFTRYLEIPFDEKTKQNFWAYLNKNIPDGLGYYQTLEAILRHYSTFQYKLGFDENVDVKKMYDFLTKKREGDCTEFANASAIIARFYGIPTRVVNGFLASQDLQLPKHKRGLYYLREKIDILKRFDFNELMMVTTSHRHAWFQAYIPPYGWIDMEATEHAIPPKLGGNPNDWNLVIPLVEEKTKQKNIPAPFPWAAVLLGVLLFAGGVIVTLYLVKYMRELLLWFRSRLVSPGAIKALGRLLIIRLVNRGFEHKPDSMTFAEYAEKYPTLIAFSNLYSELSYRIAMEPEEYRKKVTDLKTAYRAVVKMHRRLGFGRRIIYVFSLKGLRY